VLSIVSFFLLLLHLLPLDERKQIASMATVAIAHDPFATALGIYSFDMTGWYHWEFSQVLGRWRLLHFST
jgi:hypothetical protein